MPIFLENPCDRFGILSKRQKKIMCKKIVHFLKFLILIYLMLELRK